MNFKKILAMVLVVAMCFSMIPTYAFADFGWDTEGMEEESGSWGYMVNFHPGFDAQSTYSSDGEYDAWNGTVTLVPNRYVRPGYLFQGWALTEGGEVEYADEADVPVDQFEPIEFDSDSYTLDLYAVWAECAHDWDDGVVTPATENSLGYTTYTCKLCGDTKVMPFIEGVGGEGMTSGDEVTITPDALELTVGQTATLEAMMEGSFGDPADDFEWSSSNLSVATVSEAGVVTAVGVGTAQITALYCDDFGEEFEGYCNVTVTAAPAPAISDENGTSYESVNDAVNQVSGDTAITVTEETTLGSESGSGVTVPANSTVTVTASATVENSSVTAKEVTISTGGNGTTAYVVSDGTNTGAIAADSVTVGDSVTGNVSADALIDVAAVLANAVAANNVDASTVTGMELSLSKETLPSSTNADVQAVIDAGGAAFEVHPVATLSTTGASATYDVSDDELALNASFTFDLDLGGIYANKTIVLTHYGTDGTEVLGTYVADSDGKITGITMTGFSPVTAQQAVASATVSGTLTYYDSLAEAVYNADEGTTVTLLADDNVSLTSGGEIEITKPITITGPVANGEPLYTVYGTPTYNPYNDIFVNCSTGMVTISNLNIVGFGYNTTSNMGHAPVFVGSRNYSVHLDNLHISQINCEGIHINGGTFEIEDCVINASKTSSSVFTKGICIVNDASGSIKNVTITGVTCDNPKSSSAAIELQGNGPIEIDGCTIESNDIGIAANGAEGHQPGSSSVVIRNTTVSADNYSVFGDGDTGALISIESGTFTGLLLGGEDSPGLAISGGSFDDEVPEEYCADGYIPVTTPDSETGLYTVKRGAYVAEIDGVGYETLEAAIAAAQAGDTVTLLADIDYSTTYKTRNTHDSGTAHEIDLRDLTLDMGGKTITTANGTVVFGGNGATITNGHFGVAPDSNNQAASYALFIDNTTAYGLEYGVAGKVTITNVTCDGGVNVWGATVELNNVTASTTEKKYYAIWAEQDAVVTVNSGTFTDAQGSGGNNGLIATGTGNEGGAKVTVKGGTFTGSNKLVSSGEADSIKIEGGTFTVETFGTTSAINALAISGGSFNKVVPEAACADGFEPVTEADPTTGKYTVEAVPVADPVVTFQMVDSVGKIVIQGLDGNVHTNVFDTWYDGVNNRPNIRVAFTQTVTSGATATKPTNTPYYDYNITQPNNGNPKTFTNADSHAYTFDGWATADGELYDFTTPVVSDLVLHPRFSATGATIVIHNEAELRKFAREVELGRKFREQWGEEKQTVKLADDITLTSNWTPVGGFEGIFDGDNHSISGLVISATGDNAGFFSGLNSHTVVKDLTFVSPTVTSSDEYVGVLAGSASSNASTIHPQVSNVNVTGAFSVSGENNVGALIGQVNDGVQIEDCTITGTGATVTATGSDGRCVGGLLANTIGAVSVTDCSVSGVTVTGYRKIGGLIGQVQGNLTCTDASVSNVTLHTNASTDYSKALTMGGFVGIFPDSYSGSTVSGTVSDLTMTGPESISSGKNYVMGLVSGGTGGTVAEAETAMTNAGMTFDVAVSGTNTLAVPNESTYAGINGGAPYVAQIGTTGYATLADAIAAVPTDGTATTITMLADVTIAGNTGVTIPAGKNVVLDLNGHTVSNNVTTNGNSWVIKNNGTLTVQDTSESGNGKLLNTLADGVSGGQWSNYNYSTSVINNAGTLTLASGTLEQSAIGNISYAIDSTGSVSITGGTISSTNGAGIRMLCNSTTNTSSVTMTGGTINAKWGVYVQNPSSSASGNKGTLTMSGGTINATRDGITMDSEVDWTSGLAVTLSDNAAINVTGSIARAAVTLDGSKKLSGVSITGGTYNAPVGVTSTNSVNSTLGVVSGGTFSAAVPAAYCAEGYIPCTLETDPVTYSVKVGSYVAQIGDVKYESLAEAIAAAVDGDTIELLMNSTGGGLFVGPNKFTNNGVTIDFAGYTYTVETPVGSSGTVNQALHFEQGNKITLSGGTIDVTDDATKLAAFEMFMQNYGTLIIDDMNIDGTGIAVATYSDPKYQAYPEWYNTEKPQFNYNTAGASVIRNSTITMPGALGIDDAAALTIEDDAVINVSAIATKGTDDRYTSETSTIEVENGAKFKLSQTGATAFETLLNARGQSLGTPDASGVYTVEAAKVAQIGDVKYESLAAAIDAVPTDGTKTTITMLANHEMSTGVTVAAGQNIVLELNGKTISWETTQSTSSALITNEGTLTIQDTSDTLANGTGSGLITYKNTTPHNYSYYSDTITNNGTLTVKSGSITNTSTGGAAAYAIDNISNGNSCTPTLTVEGGKLYCAYSDAIRMFLNSDSNLNKVVIKGGVIDSDKSSGRVIVVQDSNAKVNKGELDISGGEIKGKVNAWSAANADDHFNNNQYEGISINITGGNIEELSFITEMTDVTLRLKSLKVTGGNYKVAPTAYLSPEYQVIDGPVPTYVYTIDGPYAAKIGTTYYATLEAAIAAVQDGQTITLLSDVSLTERLFVNAGATPAYAGTNNRYATTSDSRSITLDLNGHNITSSSNIALAGGSLNITNTGTADATHGVISTSASGLAPIEVRGTGDLSSKRTLTIGQNVTLNGSCYGLNVFGSNDAQKNVIDVTVNGTVNGMLFVLGNLKNAENEINVVVNGTVDASDAIGEEAVHTGIAACGYASVTVNNGAVVKGESGIELRAGSLTVNGGTITATAESYSYAANGSGTTTKGAAIAVAQHGTKLATNATLNGGTLSGVEQIGVTDVNSDMNNVSVVATQSYTQSSVIPEGYEWVETSTAGKYTLVKKNYVAQIGDVKYETLEAAVAAASAGDTVKLLQDITYGVDRSVPVWEKSVNIDLDGHTLTTNSGVGMNLSNMGYTAAAICFAADEGELTISNGTIVTAYGAGLYLAGHEATLSNLTINAATVGEQTTREYSAAVRITSGGKVIINSGNYSGAYAIAVSNSGGEFEINGGTFTGDIFFSTVTNSGVTKSVTIHGGTFIGGYANPNKGTLTIDGGYFKEDPTSYLAQGCVVVPLTSSATGDDKTAYDAGANYKVVFDPVASVTKDGMETKYYATIEAAVDANEWVVGSTLTLLKDVTITSTITVPSGAHDFDLNGKTVTGVVTTGSASQVITNNGTLTIIDSSGTGNGKLVTALTGEQGEVSGSWYTTDDTTVIRNNGTLNIGKTVTEGNDTTTYSGGSIVQNAYGATGSAIKNSGSVTLTSGTISANDGLGALGSVTGSTGIATSGGTVTLSGGNITGGTGVELSGGTVTLNGGNITGDTGVELNGGTLSIPASSAAVITGSTTGAGIEIAQSDASKAVIANIDGGDISGHKALLITNPNSLTSSNVSVEVSGGTFIGTGDSATKAPVSVEDTRVTKFITGGFYSDMVSEYCATNYVCLEETDESGLHQVVYAGSATFTANLTIKDSIAVNFIAKNVDSDAEAAKYVITSTFNGVTTPHQIISADKDQTTDKVYRFRMTDVFSYQMGDTIDIVVSYNGNNVKHFTYSVSKYCHNIISYYGPDSSSTYAGFVDVCYATLDYGAAAQLYFDGRYYVDSQGNQHIYQTHPEELVNWDTNPNNIVNANSPGVEYKATLSGNIEGIYGYSPALILGPETSIKLYMSGDMSKIESITCVDNKGKDRTATLTDIIQDGTRYSFKIPNLGCYELNKIFTITIIGKNGGTVVITYSPFTYMRNMWSTEEILPLMKAMVVYGNKAAEYWPN